MTDQYGNKIPDDLVLLWNEFYDNLTPKELAAIDKMGWYEQDKFGILVSWAELEKAGLEFIGIEDTEITSLPISKIDSVLHRYSSEDGFYHA